MIFDRGVLADSLSETAGYKAGLALSVAELCDHLSGTPFPDVIRASEEHIVRLRSEEYESLFYKLLHRIGYTDQEYDGDTTGIKYVHKYKAEGAEQWQGVTRLFIEHWPRAITAAQAANTKEIDARAFIRAAAEKYGKVGLNMAMERLEAIDKGFKLSPHTGARYVEWRSPVALAALFQGGGGDPQVGRFIDQRFLDYLSTNTDRLGTIHWRKFEQLTAEFFHRDGFLVQLGPGSNDDGVDVRVWKQGQSFSDHPHCLIQCKRQKDRVERVVVKGLFSDVSFENAEFGLVVTTSVRIPLIAGTHSTRWRAAFHRDRGRRSAVMAGSRARPGVTFESYLRCPPSAWNAVRLSTRRAAPGWVTVRRRRCAVDSRCAALSTAAVGACDEPAAAVGKAA